MSIDLETAEALLKVIQFLGEQFGIAIDSTNKNLVHYLQELGENIVAYVRATSCMWLIVGILLIIGGIVLVIVGCKMDWEVFHWIGMICAVVAGVIFILYNANKIIACDTFPEKVIYDYIDSISSTSGQSGY